MNTIEFEKLTIHEAEDFYKTILMLHKLDPKKLIIDFKNIKKIDISAIQILISAKKSTKLIIKNLSKDVLNSFEVASCKDYLLGDNNDR
jgi:anti-anti-sigma regulatory factor